MSHIPDMETLADSWVAVGWLEPDHPFPRGEVSLEFVARLREFARRWGQSVEALGWSVAGGYHTCEFCGKAWGSGTFGVPAGDHVFFVPEMIAHYVEQHGYAPPAEFIAAVLACPLPGTPEYVAAAEPFVERFA
jgi:hypothetical protein